MSVGGFIERQSASMEALNRRGINKARAWTVNGRRYIKNINVPPGSLVVPDPAAIRPMIDILEAVAPAYTRAVDQNLVPVAKQARAAWPVDTGLSRSLIFLSYESRNDRQYVAKLGSAAPYVWYIQKSAAARRLIFAPGTAAAMKIADRLFSDPEFRR